MFLFFFSQSMFGQLFAIRILRTFRDQKLISSRFLTKIGITFALLTTLGPQILFLPAKFSLIFIMIAVLALRLVLIWRETHQLDLLLQQFPLFVDRWLLNLRTGTPFSRARDQALSATEDHFRALITPLLDTGADLRGREHSVISARFAQELARIQKNSHQAVARLENLRDSLQKASDFRRKSGQAVRQAQTQAAVLVLLHFALTVFTGVRYGWAASFDLILLSSLMTSLGVLWLHVLARRIKWSI